jgi:hypothetical protein
MLRTDRQVPDVGLYGDVADVLKHAILTRNLDVRQIRENDAVPAFGAGYGEFELWRRKIRWNAASARTGELWHARARACSRSVGSRTYSC